MKRSPRALAAFQQDNWVGEIGQGFVMVTVLVQKPPVKHEVKAARKFGQGYSEWTPEKLTERSKALASWAVERRNH
jgi:hypothetical protein